MGSGKHKGNISNFELDDMLEDVPRYKGIFMKDLLISNLPEKGLASEEELEKGTMLSGIVNIDDEKSGRGGTHWVAWLIDPELPYGEYFDSFGLAPPKEVVEFFMRQGKLPLFNDQQFQMNESDMCGYYCAYYILERNRGEDMHDVLYSFDQFPSEKNEKMINDYDYKGAVKEVLKYQEMVGGEYDSDKRKYRYKKRSEFSKAMTRKMLSDRRELVKNKKAALDMLIKYYDMK